MIVDRLEGSEWLLYALNKGKGIYLTKKEEINIEKYVDKYKINWEISTSEGFKKKDRKLYVPFFDTIQDDILEFNRMLEYGYLNQYVEWPYNKEIEDSYIKSGLLSKKYRCPKMYNDLKEIEFHYYEGNNLYDLMNQDNWYEQAYQDNNCVRLYHFAYHERCQSFGGICLFIQKQTNEIFIFGIGEDDGWMFPETYYYNDYEETGINKFELWRLCSMVNNINVPGINNQEVISKLYKSYGLFQSQR